MPDKDGGDGDIRAVIAAGHSDQALTLVVVNHGELCTRLLSIAYLVGKIAGTSTDDRGFSGKGSSFPGFTTRNIVGIDTHRRPASVGQGFGQRKGRTKVCDTKGYVPQCGYRGHRRNDSSSSGGEGAGCGAGSDVDIVIGGMVGCSQARSRIASGHGDEYPRLSSVDQRRVEGVKFAAQASRATSPRVVEHVGSIHDDIFQGGNALSRVERAVAGNAIVKDTIAHQPGGRGDTAHHRELEPQIAARDHIASSDTGGMTTMRGPSCARPGIRVAGGWRIPSAEIGTRGDDLAVIVRHKSETALGEAWRVIVAGAVEHGRVFVQATVHRGHLDTRSGVGLATDGRVTPGDRRANQRGAGVDVRGMRIVEGDALDSG